MNALIPAGNANMECQVGNALFNYRKRISLNLPGHAYFITFSCHERKPYLKSDLCCQWLAQSLRNTCNKQGVALWAYVFMPEHVHLLIYPRNSVYRIADFLFSVKMPVVSKVKAKLKKEHPEYLAKYSSSGGTDYHFWQAGGGYDSNLCTTKEIIKKAEYCHENPIKRGLVATADEWKWSSFRRLELGKRDEPLLLDPWDET